MICTTNIQWGGTRRMVSELIAAYGKPYPPQPDLKTFPLPEAIVRDSLEQFKGKIHLGYRAPYVHELARRFVEGELDQREFLDPLLPTGEVRQKLKSIKGFGDYAAASMLMLLGRFDEIPVDTVFREFMCKKYFKERAYSQRDALAIYDEWGRWRALAYWFEMLEYD